MAARRDNPETPPRRPALGALAVVLRGDHVLMARRGRPPQPDHWGYPGGHVEWDETALQAAARELREETGVIAHPRAYLTNVDAMFRDAGGTTVSHYLLAAVLCDYVSGTPLADDDIVEAEWVPIHDVQAASRPLHDGVQDVLEIALRRRAETA